MDSREQRLKGIRGGTRESFDKMARAIFDDICWCETEEGSDFWLKVNQKLRAIAEVQDHRNFKNKKIKELEDTINTAKRQIEELKSAA